MAKTTTKQATKPDPTTEAQAEAKAEPQAGANSQAENGATPDATTEANAEVNTTGDQVRLRSKYAQHTLGGVQFSNHYATVSRAVYDRLASKFIQTKGVEWWVDTAPPAVASPPGGAQR